MKDLVRYSKINKIKLAVFGLLGMSVILDVIELDVKDWFRQDLMCSSWEGGLFRVLKGPDIIENEYYS